MKLTLKISFIILAFSVVLFAQPNLEVSPDPLKFGYISSGGLQQRELTLTNTGDQLLVIDSCHFNLPFHLPSINNLEIAAGSSYTLTVDFRPLEERGYDESIVFYSNSTDTEYNLDVTGTGARVFTPGEVIWSYQHIESVVSVQEGDDYNHDGIPDLFAEGYDAGAVGDPLVCLSGSGQDNTEVIWSVQPQGGSSNSGGYGDKCLAFAGDLNGDGFGDLFRGTSWGGCTAFAIDGLTGSTLWSYDSYINGPFGWIYSVASLGDINDDGIPEALAGLGSEGNRTICLDGATGNLIWTYNADDGVACVASIEDINDDGYNDALFGALDYGDVMYCVSGASSGNGTPIWLFNVGESFYSITSISDLNDDGYEDAIAGTWGRGIMAFSGHRAGNGMIIWETPFNYSVMRVVACPDLNDDGLEEVLVASWGAFAEVLSGADGVSLWRYYCGDDVWAIDYISDVTEDDVPEVIAGSFNHNVYCIDGNGGSLVWQTYVGAKPFSVREISDVNGDGFSDVIVGTQFLNGTGGKVFVISGGEVQTSVDDIVDNIPGDIMLPVNYPNPFNSNTVISFNLKQDEKYNLDIFDIGGRLIEHYEAMGHAGENHINWDLSTNSEVVSGVYFYKITTKGESGQGKMTYLK